MKNKIKERMERILHGSILFTTLLTLAFPVQAWAKVGGNETEYTYTVTLCSGNQGYFSDTNGITVDNHITGSSYQIEKESQGEKIKISGLKYGDRRYGSECDPLGRLALHAFKLCFYHPVTRELMEFETPYPTAFKGLMQKK